VAGIVRALRPIDKPEELEEEGELVNVVLITFVEITPGEGNLRSRIEHAGFEGIEDSEGVRGAQLVCHVTPALLENWDEARIVRHPEGDPGIGDRKIVLVFETIVQRDRKMV
jgi:hypothetical protein